MTPTEDDAWAAYLYPGTDVLRNKFGYTDPADLALAERYASQARQSEIESGADVPSTYDGAHLRAIHRYLFQDVYEWAGDHRTVTMAKPGGEPFAQPDAIDFYLSVAAGFVARTNWPTLDQAATAHWAGAVYAWINTGHPFRDGNGRAGRVWLTQVVEQSRWRLDLSAIRRDDWIKASAESSPRTGQFEPNFRPLARLLATPGAIAATASHDLPWKPDSAARRAYAPGGPDRRVRQPRQDPANGPATPPRRAEPDAATNYPAASRETSGTRPLIG